MLIWYWPKMTALTHGPDEATPKELLDATDFYIATDMGTSEPSECFWIVPGTHSDHE